MSHIVKEIIPLMLVRECIGVFFEQPNGLTDPQTNKLKTWEFLTL